MSSIDKYVISIAKSIISKVKVTNIGSYLVGRINGETVFRIKDRYGYISEEERAEIRKGINDYDEAEKRRKEEEERRRKEEEERERKRLENSFLEKISSNKKALENDYKNNISYLDSLIQKANSAKVNIDGVDATVFNNKIIKFVNDLNIEKDKLTERYNKQYEKLVNLQNNSVGKTKGYYLANADSVNKNISLTGDVHTLENPINDLCTESTKIINACSQLFETKEKIINLIESDESNLVLKNVLNQITNLRITDFESINVVLHKLLDIVNQVENLKIEANAEKNVEKIIELKQSLYDISKSLQDYSVKQSYKVNESNDAIIGAVKLKGRLSYLNNLEFKVFSNKRADEIELILNNILSGNTNVNSLQILAEIDGELNEYEIGYQDNYNNYNDYIDKVNELVEYGKPLSEIPKFDVFNYSGQKKYLNNILLEFDINKGINLTNINFTKIVKAMNKMGYEMFSYDLGDDSKSQLVQECCFAIPGCDGVAIQIIVSGDSIRRKLVGIKRSDGSITPIERVKEVAEILENDGEIVKFWKESYANEFGGIKCEAAVDSNTSNCLSIIEENGYCELTEKAEECYDEIVNSADKSKWNTSHTCRVMPKTTVISTREVKEKERKASYSKYQSKRLN